MAIQTVFLQTEAGKIVAAVRGLYILDRDPHDPEKASVLPATADEAFVYLPYLDGSSDTYFNRLQMQPFIKEWDLLPARTTTQEQLKKVLEVRTLALRCASSTHLLLKFLGD